MARQDTQPAPCGWDDGSSALTFSSEGRFLLLLCLFSYFLVFRHVHIQRGTLFNRSSLSSSRRVAVLAKTAFRVSNCSRLSFCAWSRLERATTHCFIIESLSTSQGPRANMGKPLAFAGSTTPRPRGLPVPPRECACWLQTGPSSGAVVAFSPPFHIVFDEFGRAAIHSALLSDT